jgi:hypothetical protein
VSAPKKSAPAATETLWSRNPSAPFESVGSATHKVACDAGRGKWCVATRLRVPNAAVGYEEEQ